MIAQPCSRTTLRNRRVIRLGRIARHGVELVERAAGMAEAAPGNHRHIAAASRHRRRQRQADRVADAAGRVLVERRAGQIVPVQHRAGIAHRQRQRHALAPAHIAEEHRHGEGRDLTLADRAIRQPGDELSDILRRQLGSVALGGDDFLGQLHLNRFRPPRRHPRPDAASSSTWCSPLAPKRKRVGSRPIGAHDRIGKGEVQRGILQGADAARGLQPHRPATTAR